MKNQLKLILENILLILPGLIIATLSYSLIYPKLYNIINSVTERGDDLDDKIDFVNTFLTISSLYLFFVLFMFLLVIASTLIFKKVM
jgi:hypothetical protein